MKTNKTPTSNNLVTNVTIEIQKDSLFSRIKSTHDSLLELKQKEKNVFTSHICYYNMSTVNVLFVNVS